MCPVVPCLFLYFFTISGQMGICFRRIQNQRKQKRQESSMWSNTAICHDLIKRAKILEIDLANHLRRYIEKTIMILPSKM